MARNIKKYRKHLKDEKRILKLAFRTGVLEREVKVFNPIFKKHYLEYIGWYKNFMGQTKLKLYFKDEYFGGKDRLDLTSILSIDDKYFEAKYRTTKEIIRYLKTLPIKNSKNISKVLKTSWDNNFKNKL